jgi:hypothetical protein
MASALKCKAAGVLGALALLSAADPSRVLAFADANFFGFPAAGGGAGGRYFTGSPLDSYTCDACHTGAEAPAVHVLGLPLAGYVPGSRYEITVDWSDDLINLATSVELTDISGRRAGTLRLPQGEEIEAPELCDRTTQLAAKVILVPADGQVNAPHACDDAGIGLSATCRQVVHSRDCGAQRLRFLWTAPPWDVGPIWFAGSAVVSNADSTDRGDGVTQFAHRVASAGADDVDTTKASCAAVPGRRRSSASWGLLASLFASCVGWRRRRNARNGAAR